MSTFKGDFLGFSYNGIHCSELGIFRVSSGDRYSTYLSPASKLQTMERPGADGTYYFGKNFKDNTFDISFAFDNVSDKQLRKIKQLLSTKGIHELIFDEEPFKVWDVQISGQPQFKFVAFDEGNIYESFGDTYNTYLTKYGKRVYKGEGTIKFICYDGFAHSPKNKKYLRDYPEWEYANRIQWAVASGLADDEDFLTSDGKREVYDIINDDGEFYTFNAGDIETPISLKLYFSQSAEKTNLVVMNEPTEEFLEVKIPQLFAGDHGIEINSKSLLIMGIDGDGQRTGTLYNRYILHGDFFNIPVGFNHFVIISDNIDFAKSTVDYQHLYY